MSTKRSSISNRYTELIDITTYDLNRLHFDSANELELQQGNKTIKYYKINIGSKNKNGVGEFVFDLPEFCHSFGVEEFQNEAGKATNYSVSLSLVDLNDPTDTQMNVVKSFGAFIEKIKDHLLTVKKEIKKPTLDRAELKKFNPMYQSIDEDGNVKGTAWYFSPKLMIRKIYNKEDPTDMQLKIETKFFSEDQTDESGEPVEMSPLVFTGKKHFKFRGAVKIETIYIGSKISLQCKVYDGVVRTVSTERKRLTVIKKNVVNDDADQGSDLEIELDEE